ncbi:MAG: nucleoside deaminase [Cyclobacteriaceae bacterium]|nr:nucleoside deaminase [Cyclobacteriaceae bacterium]
MIEVYNDEYFMRQAMLEAERALEEGEVPVGAVVVSGKKIIARAYNQTEKLNDATAHAEMLALTSASNYLGSKYLTDCTLYVTLEPCAMCIGATYWTQISEIVYAAKDEKRGFSCLDSNMSHPKTKLRYGLLAEESEALLKIFFQRIRG